MMETAIMGGSERREYPRIQANCPVRYRINGEGDWQNATLVDYSATGVCIQSEELLLKGTRLHIVVSQGSSRNVPNFSAEGEVVRFTLDEDHCFKIGCKFNDAIRVLISTPES